MALKKQQRLTIQGRIIGLQKIWFHRQPNPGLLRSQGLERTRARARFTQWPNAIEDRFLCWAGLELTLHLRQSQLEIAGVENLNCPSGSELETSQEERRLQLLLA